MSWFWRWVVGRRYGNPDGGVLLHYRAHWWAVWKPVKLTKKVLPLEMTDEVFTRLTRGEL